MHYFRLWISFAKNCLSRELEFRQNFLVRISGNILWFITTILFFRVIYLHTPTIGGWELWQSMLLVSTNQIINYIYSAFFGQNLSILPRYVNRGDLDFVITKPVDTQFFISVRHFDFYALMSLIFPIGLICYTLLAENIALSTTTILLYLLLLLCGITIRYGISLLVMTISFWTTEMGALYTLCSEFLGLSGYPASIYRGAVNLFFTFVIPVIVIANFPVMVLTGDLRASLLIYTFLLSFFFFATARLLFYFGIKRYCSASS